MSSERERLLADLQDYEKFMARKSPYQEKKDKKDKKASNPFTIALQVMCMDEKPVQFKKSNHELFCTCGAEFNRFSQKND